MTAQPAAAVYPARLDVDYLEQHDRVTTFFRAFLFIPIAIVSGLLTAGATQTVYERSGEAVRHTSGGITAGLFAATMLMILFRQRYPRGLFDYVVGVGRWWLRVQAYATLLVTDRYPPFSPT